MALFSAERNHLSNFSRGYHEEQLKGSRQQGALVHFSLVREKRKKHKIWQFSNHVDFSCINEQDMFDNSEFRRFCNDSTALSEKNLILAISFLQSGT